MEALAERLDVRRIARSYAGKSWQSSASPLVFPGPHWWAQLVEVRLSEPPLPSLPGCVHNQLADCSCFRHSTSA